MLEHPLEHHGLVIIVLLYNDHCSMLCAMEFRHSKQDIILLSVFSIDYIARALLNDTRETLYYATLTNHRLCLTNIKLYINVFNSKLYFLTLI